MPFKCVVAGCPHKSWIHKTLKFYTFPRDEKLRRKWKKEIQLRHKSFEWKHSSRVCSAHFVGGRKQTSRDIPSIFPRIDREFGDVVWPIDISHLLQNESLAASDVATGEREIHETEVVSTEETGTEEIAEKGELFDEEEPEELRGVEEESKCSCQEKINKLSERIEYLEKQLEVQKFGVKRFQCSDSDIRFYTGLPNYNTFYSLYTFLKPRAGYQLNYQNGYQSKPRDPSYVVARGRPRKLCEIDELFLTLSRLRLGYLERDLADRFDISVSEVSITFSTWVDRMADCLGQITFITDRETIKTNLPNCLKPDYENVYFIIDCTELNIEKPSEVTQQSATWSEYKGHNTGKGLLALSPLLLPVIVSDIYPGSISDEDMVIQSGILEHTQRGDVWLADKGFLIQHILDDYGVRVETPVKLEGKKQFTEEEDVINRRNSQVRVHVERALRRVKVFRILKGDIPIRSLHLLSKVWKVCAWLTAFLPPLINEKGDLVDGDREE